MISERLQTKLIDLSRLLYHVPRSNYKHFSFIVRRSKIVAFGFNNSKKTHPTSPSKYHTIHSELSAICSFPYPVSELHKFSFINIRLFANKQLAMSKPCKACQKMLSSFGVRKVYYSTPNGFGECILNGYK